MFLLSSRALRDNNHNIKTKPENCQNLSLTDVFINVEYGKIENFLRNKFFLTTYKFMLPTTSITFLSCASLWVSISDYHMTKMIVRKSLEKSVLHWNNLVTMSFHKNHLMQRKDVLRNNDYLHKSSIICKVCLAM